MIPCCGHASDCAVHNGPADISGPCDCNCKMPSCRSNRLVADLVKHQLSYCSCYGHLCYHCIEAKELLVELRIIHRHKARYENGKVTDRCDLCGRDLRDDLHERIAQ